jgi:hypothetical protein
MDAGYFPKYGTLATGPDPSLKSFITNFYQLSDVPSAERHGEWVSQFMPDATVSIGMKKAMGQAGVCFVQGEPLSARISPGLQASAEILRLRESMWEKVSERKHTVSKVFPAQFLGSNEEGKESSTHEPTRAEVMILGSVDYKLKAGGEQSVAWAGHGMLRRESDEMGGGQWKFEYYKVWL